MSSSVSRSKSANKAAARWCAAAEPPNEAPPAVKKRPGCRFAIVAGMGSMGWLSGSSWALPAACFSMWSGPPGCGCISGFGNTVLAAAVVLGCCCWTECRACSSKPHCLASTPPWGSYDGWFWWWCCCCITVLVPACKAPLPGCQGQVGIWGFAVFGLENCCVGARAPWKRLLTEGGSGAAPSTCLVGRLWVIPPPLPALLSSMLAI